jgi:phosphatidylserine/phosphatidylglycerophosphate/cardiolipin synthase-like enzyme
VQLFQNKPGTGVRKIHHKLMVIDERLVIAGSFNYIGPAGALNARNILVLGDLEETNPAAETAQRRLATYALAELERIITDLCEPFSWEPEPSE